MAHYTEILPNGERRIVWYNPATSPNRQRFQEHDAAKIKKRKKTEPILLFGYNTISR